MGLARIQPWHSLGSATARLSLFFDCGTPLTLHEVQD